MVEVEEGECGPDFREELRQALGERAELSEDWANTAVVQEAGNKVFGQKTRRLGGDTKEGKKDSSWKGCAAGRVIKKIKD